MKKLYCFISILALSATAQGQEKSNFWQELKATVDLSYTSQYMMYGYDFGGGQGAFQPSISLDYHGWYIQFWTSFPDASGVVNGTEFDYIFGYNRTLFADDWCKTDLTVSYIYFDYPFSDSRLGLDGWKDGQELSLSASWPKIIPAIGSASITPFYVMAYEWDGVQSSHDFDNGWLFNFGITYEFPIPPYLPHQKNQTLVIMIDTFYNDGIWRSDAGLSHGTISVSTTTKLFGFTFSPTLLFQSSWENSVCDEDMLFAKISISRTF